MAVVDGQRVAPDGSVPVGTFVDPNTGTPIATNAAGQQDNRAVFDPNLYQYGAGNKTAASSPFQPVATIGGYTVYQDAQGNTQYVTADGHVDPYPQVADQMTAENGWSKTGGNSTSDVYVNQKTGATIFVTKATGAVEGSQYLTAEQRAQGEANLGVRGAARDLKDQLDTFNPVGTPGLDKDAIDQKVVNGDIVGAGKEAVGDTVGAAGDVIGGIPGLGGLGGGSALSGQASDNIQAAIARQAAISDAQGQAAANYQNVAAPTAAGPGQIYAEFAQQQSPIQAQIAQAEQAKAAQVGRTVLTPQQQAIQAQQIAAANIGPLAQAQGAQVGSTQVGQTALANAAQVDTSQQAQFRAAQTGLVSGLQGAIAGTEPSAAEIMLRNATDRNVANQYAMAQAANGMNTGQAQRTAMINAADMNQQAIMQQALLRAQEITAARGQLGGVLDSARGADIGLATNQAGLQQQTGLTNAGAQNTSTLTQAQIDAARNIAQGQLTQGASTFNAGQANDAATTQAQLAQAAAAANQGANLQGQTTNATLAQQVALANTAAQNTTQQTNAQMQQAASLQNAQLGTQASLANAGNATQAATSSAQLANAVQLANAQNQTQANVTGAQLNTQAGIANANNTVSTNALNQKAVQDLTGNQITAAGQAGQTAIGQGDVEAKLAAAEAQKQAAIIAAVAAGGAKLLSDRRAKTDIAPAEAEIAQWTSTLKPSSWRYKNPDQPGAAPGKRFGFMIDDLEKSEVGRSLVRRRPDGLKEVDVPQSIGAILATLSAMNKRIEAR